MSESNFAHPLGDRTLTRRDLLAGAAGLAGLAAFGAAPREAEAASASVSYRVHVQRIGWSQGWKSNGATAGTSGKSLRLEAIQIKLAGKPVSGSIQYRTHVQKQGWQGWRSDGATSGTSGKSLRLEAIQIRLTGQMAERYDVWYRVHAQMHGWMGWAKNGASAGTSGCSYRLEAIQIKIVSKGFAAPGSTAKPFSTQRVYTNTDAHNAYASTLKAIKKEGQALGSGYGSSSGGNVLYRYADVCGNGLDELICETTFGSAADHSVRVYTFENGKVKKLLEYYPHFFGGKYTFYKSCSSFVLYHNYGGCKVYEYFQLKGGSYEFVASRENAYDEGWTYRVGGSSCSKSQFDTCVGKLTKGTAISFASGDMNKL